MDKYEVRAPAKEYYQKLENDQKNTINKMFKEMLDINYIF